MTEVFIKALLNNNKKILKRTSKIIALWVRGEIEDLHSDGEISQATMAKLNPLVRHAIYNALFALANSDQSVEARQLLQFYESSIPDYWEEPELEEILEKNIPFDGRWEKPTFSLDFLTKPLWTGSP